MSRTLFTLVSVLLLSLASTGHAGILVGNFEGALDGWYTDQWTKGAITVSPIGATVGILSMQVTAATGVNNETKVDMKANRAKFGVRGMTVTADVTAFEADLPGGTKLDISMIINGQNDDQSGANNNIGWRSIAKVAVARDGQPHKYTWTMPDELADAIAKTNGSIWWFELAIESDTDATATKFYIDNIQLNDPAKKVAFVTFHSADDAPSTAAVNNGFTTAPDKGYTDLLKAAGYAVTRVVQSNNPDVNALNAMDLVIVSRSVASGSFQSAAADIWNTKITKPLINLNGYTLRKSRLGFYIGSTIPDTTGAVKLAVADVNNPIFEGIELVNGTMKNPFATLLTYADGVAARGISVVTDAADPNGVVLATIAAAEPNTTATGPAGAVMIAEWQAGATLTHDGGAGKSTLAGRRLVFLTGSREAASGKDAQTAGMCDLTEDGAKLFLNAVKYMLTPPPGSVVNLLANGTFETGTTDSWGIWGGSTFEAVTELVGATVADGPIEGKYCLHVTVPAKTTNFWDTAMNTAPPVFAAGKKYTLSVWLKSKSGPVTVNLKPEHSASPWEGYNEKQVTMTEQWAEYSITTDPFAADVSPASITFHLGFAPAEFWMDNVRWYEGEYVKP